jgi:hypothetical protein
MRTGLGQRFGALRKHCVCRHMWHILDTASLQTTFGGLKSASCNHFLLSIQFPCRPRYGC